LQGTVSAKTVGGEERRREEGRAVRSIKKRVGTWPGHKSHDRTSEQALLLRQTTQLQLLEHYFFHVIYYIFEYLFHLLTSS
jgi:hypothetical protein